MRFGRYPENVAVKQYWGARAIFTARTGYTIDLLPDRQTYEGQKEQAKEFIDWINNEFLQWLRSQATFRLYSDQQRCIKYTSKCGKYHGEACCQGSHGYLYIGCWEEAA